MADMTSRERVIATLRFQKPDRIPLDIWCLGSARIKHGRALEKLLSRYETDLRRAGCSMVRNDYINYHFSMQ